MTDVTREVESWRHAQDVCATIQALIVDLRAEIQSVRNVAMGSVCVTLPVEREICAAADRADAAAAAIDTQIRTLQSA